ncbi:MAG: response regulator [Isosphaeraceae bacterium]|nr:response regulator [Isosphaeraceae bacterium]
MNDETPSILLVDDDVDICASMADIFADVGYSVDFAHEGARALELVRRRPYDVALLDLKMPGMDGVTLCREIRRVRSGTVSLLVTAYAGGDTVQEARDAGAWRILAKPVDFPSLMGLIDDVLKQPLVLVVDDDPDMCASLRDLMRELGYRVCIAHDLREAIERLQETTRVVLLDLRLPGEDGGVVFQRLREMNAAVPVVLITGYPAEMGPLVDRLGTEGFDAVHYKPLDIPRLLADLARLAGPATARGRVDRTTEI